MSRKLEIFMSHKGTSVKCPALRGQVIPTISCVNEIHHCDCYADLATGRRGKHYVICTYDEKRARPLVFGRGRSRGTPTDRIVIKEGKDRKFLREYLQGDASELERIRKKLVEQARRKGHEKSSRSRF